MSSITRKQIAGHAKQALTIANNIIVVKSKVGKKAALELTLWKTVKAHAEKTLEVLNSPNLDLQELVDIFGKLIAAEKEAKSKLD